MVAGKALSCVFLWLIGTPSFAANPKIVDGFVAYQQVDHNACWAATTQMILKFQNPNSNIQQCEIASKLRGKDCCAMQDASECYIKTRIEDAWAAYGLSFEYLKNDESRWPIDPERIISELDSGNLVLLRWARGSRGNPHVNIAAGYGKENGETYIHLPDSAAGDIQLFEDSWTQYFPHVLGLDDFSSLAVPFAYRAWVIPRSIPHP